MGCLLMEAIVHLLILIKEDAEEAEEEGSTLDANELWKVGAYICVLTAALLHGHEGFFMELAGLCNHLVKGRVGTVPENLNKNTVLSEEMCRDLPHVTMSLLGNFKGETGMNHHLIALAN
jgi:hypothetical protein